MRVRSLMLLLFLVRIPAGLVGQAPGRGDEVGRLVAAVMGDTPMVQDLAQLADRIGGRPTGSAANLRAIDWAVERFRTAGVEVRREPFTMPGLWLERSASATVRGEGMKFTPRVAALPFSTATPAGGTKAQLVDGGTGEEEGFR